MQFSFRISHNVNCLTEFGDSQGIAKNNAKLFNLYQPELSTSTMSQGQIAPVPDKFPRTYLLLSLWQMVVENYPVPVKGELSER